MLAVLLIKMKWFKESRTPVGAIQRQEYYKPIKIEDGVNLLGEGIFYKRCRYYQKEKSVFPEEEIVDRLDNKLYEIDKGKAFAGKDEKKHRLDRLRAEEIRRDKGSFYPIDNIEIPCIMIHKEADNVYRIKWFDDRKGMPRRRGGNEDLYSKGARLAGQPNILNETAFILDEGEAGLLKYNYRYTSYHGQWYECYYVYIVNEKNLTQDIFLRAYDYEYDQLADLF